MELVKRVYIGFLDILFPRQCVGCQKMETWICDGCLASINRRFEQECYRCYGGSPKGITCSQCKTQGSHILDGLVVAAPYKGNKQLERMLYGLKYQSHDEELGEKLSTLVWNAMNRVFSEEVLNRMVVIPTPLYAGRLRERGFNQSEVLTCQFAVDSRQKTESDEKGAESEEVKKRGREGFDRDNGIRKHRGLVVRTDVLERHEKTKSQVEAGKRKERQENLKGAFIVVGKIDPQAFYILVDDVCTTGSTLEECCRMLRESGARYVWGVVVARA
jgi:competence protein ComFC